MDTETLEGLLYEAIENVDGDATDQIVRIATFEERMLLTSDRGLVLTMEDGSEFQITIVQSALPNR